MNTELNGIWKLWLQGYMKIIYQSLFPELANSMSQGTNPAGYEHKKIL